MVYKPKISVVMSVYNDRGGLNKTIESVLNQSFRDFEFIIICDGSNEETKNRVFEWAKMDDRISIIIQEKNIGLTKALNVGLNNARSDLIARIDEGDTWEVDKLQLQYDFIKNNHEYVVVGTYSKDINVNTGKSSIFRPPVEDLEIRKWFLKGLNPFRHPSVLFRKVLSYNESLTTSQDYELWLRLFFIGKFYNIPEVLINYSIDYESITFSVEKGYYSFINYKKVYLHFIKALKDENYRTNFLHGVNYKINNDANHLAISPLKKKALAFFLRAKAERKIVYKILANLLNPGILLFNLRKKYYYLTLKHLI